jgi:LAS superfamily LD-carboxypeptidase LdcB
MAIDDRLSDDDKNKNIDGSNPSNNPSDNSRGIPLSPKANPKKSKLDKLRAEREAKDATFLERMFQSNNPEEKVEEVKESRGMFDGVFGDSKKKKKADEGDFIGGLFGRNSEDEDDAEDVQPVEEKPGFFDGLFTPDKKEEKTTSKGSSQTQSSEPNNQATNIDSSTLIVERDQKAEKSNTQPKSTNASVNIKNEDTSINIEGDSTEYINLGDNNRLEKNQGSRPQPKRPNVNPRSQSNSDKPSQTGTTQGGSNRDINIGGKNTGYVNVKDGSNVNINVPSYKDQVDRYNPKQQSNGSPSQSRDRYTSPNQSRSTTSPSSTTSRRKFDSSRKPQRSKKGTKMGLVAAAAIAAANLGSGGAQASSGIFNTPKSQVNQPTQVTNFEDQTSRPSENLAIDEFGIDTVGYNEDGSLSNAVNKGDGKKKQDKNQGSNNQSQQGSNAGTKTKSASPINNYATGPIPSLPNSAGAGQYDGGQLSVPLMEKTGFEGVGPGSKLSADQALKAPPIGQQPTKGMPTQSASKQAPQLANMSGSGKKKIDAGKLAMAVIKPWLMQFAILFIILFALFSGLFGAVFKGVTQVIASFCTSTEFVRGLPGLKDTQAGKFANKACETLKALTGLGCGGLDSSAATGIGCVGKLLEAPGDKVNLEGPGGTTPVKKACIQEIISSGKKAGVKEFTIRFAIAIHPIESVGDCFKAINPYGCLGLAQFCTGGSYESAIRGTGTTSAADFIANPDKQMKAIENFLAEKKSFIGGLPSCVENFFKGKTLQFQLSYLWLTGGCPGTVDANGFRNDKYGEIADKNFGATDCNEFKTKLGSSDQTNYWQVINSFGKLKTEITAQAQMSGPDVADKALQDEVISLINSGKIVIEVLDGRTKEMMIADIRGTDGGGLQNQPINGPPHKNTIAMMKLLADRFPGYAISSLGNNTHHYSGGYHNKAPIQAIDFGAFAGGVDTEDMNTETFNKLLDVLIESKIVYNIGLPPGDLARLDQKKLDQLKAFTDGAGHLHISILASGTLGSSFGNGSTEACTFNEDQISTNQDRVDITKRLNKKSLTDTEWSSLQKKFGKVYTANQFVRIGDDATFGNADKLVLFDNKTVSERIYKFAIESGYKERISAPLGDLVGEGEQRMRFTAKKALEALGKAAKTDGYKIALVSGFRTPLEQKGIFEDKLQELCQQKIGSDCTIADLAAGKHDGLIKERLATSSVPGYSKHHTGLAADVLETAGSPLDQTFKKSELYKWISEDNFFNLKRFGFIPSYPDGGENMGPFPEPWEILYVGPTAVQSTQVESDAKKDNTPTKLGPVGPNGTFNPNLPTQTPAPTPGSTPSNIDGPTSTSPSRPPTQTPSDIDGPTPQNPNVPTQI